MGQRLLYTHSTQVGPEPPPERAPAAGDQGPPDLVGGDAGEELPHRRMLAVDGPDLAGAGLAHDELAGRHQALLVGEGEDLARPERRQGRLEPSGPHDAVEHDRCLGGLGHLGRRHRTLDDPDVVGGVDLPLREPEEAHAELLGLGQERLPVRVGGESGHPEPVRMGPDDVEGLAADGAGGAEHRDGDRLGLLEEPVALVAGGDPRGNLHVHSPNSLRER